MNKKILKINSWILKIIGFALIILSTIWLIFIVSIPSEPNSFDNLGKVIACVATFIAYIFALPFIMSGIVSSKIQKENQEVKNKNFKKESSKLSIISIISSILFVFIFMLIDLFGYYREYATGYVNIKLKIIHILIIFFIFVLPQLINLIGLSEKNISFKNIWKDKKTKYIIIAIFIILLVTGIKLTVKQVIITKNKMEITEDKLYTYWDFREQLENRNLYGQKGASWNRISAMDSTERLPQKFSEVNNPANAMIYVGEDRKFPFFIYDTYTTLIQKRDKKTPNNYIDYDDVYAHWIIYYVDGKIYAALDQESEDGPLARTKYGVVVSEEDYITVYNARKNYLVKGGCIMDTASGTQRSGFPTTKDIYDKRCIKIKKVERIDSKTLDSIAKTILNEYYKNISK